jgi:DNA-directed RNA polymerase specialized sigma24 family protein
VHLLVSRIELKAGVPRAPIAILPLRRLRERDSAGSVSKTPCSSHFTVSGLEPDWNLELERSYGPVLRGLLAVARSRERAEDAMQEAILAALQQKPGEIRRLDAWLYVVGLRSLRRSLWKDRLLAPFNFLGGASPAPDIRRLEVDELLRQLTESQREFVVASYYHGLSYQEIAEHFGVSLGTATSTVNRAFSKLRRSLGDDNR